ncbi:Gfo/Idh/MocA family protein [Saccharothrix hoggarensis]|uniref:Gfo/Idh/MocA family protein n=1 Tax=Saccharothrix hoggarensis TaxID=913853 RepID=A0ABW3R6N3_9PSEU
MESTGERVRVGLVGVGTIARTHLEVLADRPGVDLVFTVDPRAEPPVFRGDVPAHHRDVTSALAAHRPDLVVIATPADSHADLAAQVLTTSDARVLVEKPLVLDPADLDRLSGLDGVRDRLFTAHHFAFSPEVEWAAARIAAHPEWGPVTGVTSAFYDPYVLKGERAFTSYISAWADSGINQLSVLSRLVDVVDVTSLRDEGASCWAVASFRSRGAVGTARLRADWMTGASSKSTVVTCGEVEVWLDHTAMTAFAFRGGELLDAHGSDGRTPRKVAHYRPLYASLLSDRPDPVLGFATASALTALHAQHARHAAKAVR